MQSWKLASQKVTNKQLPNTSSSCTEDKTSVSVSDLESLTNQCSAAGRLRRESLVQADGGIRQSTYQILTKSLNKKLSNLELLGDNSRSLVIQLTPRTQTTSTPSNYPPSPEVPSVKLIIRVESNGFRAKTGINGNHG